MDWMHNNVLRIAEVLEVHPESNSISVRFVDDGSRIPDVPVMSSSGSTRTGTVDLPVPEVGEDEERDLKDTEKVYAMAIIAMTSTLPVCLGFVQPAVNELAFKDKPNLRVFRHASDVVTIIQDNGDVELQHPSGAYVKIGVTHVPMKLEGEDYDKKWMVRRNKHLVFLTINVNGATFTIKPDNGVNLTTSGDLSISARNIDMTGANVSISASGDMTRSAGGMILDDTQTHHTTGQHTDANGKHCPDC